MFRRLNKKIKANLIVRLIQGICEKGARPLSRCLSNESAQVAIVLIIIIAFALIFYAVTLNLGKIAQTKTQITIAANVGGALLASQMASYGQQKFMEELGGRRKRCGFTLLGRILLFGALIVLAVATPFVSVSLIAAIVAATMAVTAITIDLLVIEPGINELWNKHIAVSMDQASGFLESGVRTAIQTAVSDRARVLDEYDTDIDGIYGGSVSSPNDEITRFAVYYTERLKSVQGPDPTVVQAFIDALRELLYEENDGWGIYDPVDCNFNCCYDANTNPVVPSVCNRCCWPLSVTLPDGDIFQPRDDCCNPPCTDPFSCSEWPPCGIDSTCGDHSPGNRFPGISPFPSPYEWVYDPFYENPTNAFLSFRESLGRDDEHRDYNRDLANIQFDPIEQFADGTPDFQIEDATGFLNFEGTVGFGGSGFGIPGNDLRPGIFPFFYKVRDWALDLTDLDPATEVNHCFWYDDVYEPLCDQVATPFSDELMNHPLSLPNDPATLICNTTPCVDSTAGNCGLGGVCGNPLAVDGVFLPAYIVSEQDDADYCAQQVLYPIPDPSRGFWKEGGDRYCSTAWPYEEQCAKAGGWSGGSPPTGPCADIDSDGNYTIYRDCLCGETSSPETSVINPPQSGASWPDDPLDDLVYLTNEFIEWAESIIDISAETLARDLIEWYPEAAEWIEPGIRSGATPMVDCFVCNEDDGFLWQWLFNLQQMRNRLQNMLLEDYGGATCDEVWCAPESGLSCPLIYQDEAATMGSSALYDPDPGAGDVLDCLDHNINFIGPMGGAGNAGRFQDCFDECFEAAADQVTPQDQSHYPLGTSQNYMDSNLACGDGVNTFLPRSLISGFDPSGQFVPADMVNLNPYLSCPDFCTNPGGTGCIDACNNIYGDCTASCDAALAACQTACGSPASPTCLQACDGAWDDCVNTNCNNDQTACYDDCECVINGVTYECNQTLNALLTSLNTDAEAGGYKGSCMQSEFSIANGGAGGGFFDLLEQSIPEAENQVAKFQQRHDFLLVRVIEINHIIGLFDTAIAQLDAFLNGPAAALIQERINYSGEALPYEVIYGWQGDPPPGNPAGRGLWHIVMVEGRIPARCDDACDPSQTMAQPWPTTRTYRRALGTQRCYELNNTDGIVKLRVTRYDENRPSNPLFFPSGLRIWDFRSHPDRSAGNFAGNIDVQCPPYTSPGGTTFTGAFMNNGQTSGGTQWSSTLPSDNGACYSEATRLLSDYGIQSETCAKYYDQVGTDEFEGFDFQFVPCAGF